MASPSPNPTGASQPSGVSKGVHPRTRVNPKDHEEDNHDDVEENWDITTSSFSTPRDMRQTGSGRPQGSHSGSGPPWMSLPQNEVSHSQEYTEFHTSVEPTIMPSTMETSYYQSFEESPHSYSTELVPPPMRTTLQYVPESTSTVDPIAAESQKHKQHAHHLASVAGGVSAVIVTVFICVICYFYRRKKKANQKKGEKQSVGADGPEMSATSDTPVSVQNAINEKASPPGNFTPTSPIDIPRSPPPSFDSSRPPLIVSTRMLDRNYNTGLYLDDSSNSFSNSHSEINSTGSEPLPAYRSTEASLRTEASSIRSVPAALSNANLQTNQAQIDAAGPEGNPFADSRANLLRESADVGAGNNPFDDPVGGDDISEMSASTLERDPECRSEVSSLSYQGEPAVPTTAV